MALGRQGERQSEMLVAWSEMPCSRGHVFYDRRQAELVAAGFDGFVEQRCAAHDAARPAVVNNRTRLLSGVGRLAFRLRAELVERCFALVLDRGGMRRAWLRGRENIHKRYLVHVAGYNLGLIMRLLTGAGTPRALRARICAHCARARMPTGGILVLLIVAADHQTAAIAVSIQPDRLD